MPHRGFRKYIVLEIVGVAMLDGRVATDAHLLAEGLATGRAIYVSDQGAGMALVRSHQLVPIGLHALAVPSPGRKEFDCARAHATTKKTREAAPVRKRSASV